MNMRKNLLTGSGIIILALIASIFLQPNPEILIDAEDHAYMPLSKKEAVLNYKRNDVFVVAEENSHTIQRYQILGFPSEKISISRFTDTNSGIANMPDQFNQAIEPLFHYAFSGIVQNDDQRIDTLKKLGYHERKALIKPAVQFEGRRFLNNEEARTDWFTKIDDSVFIFLLISLIPFFILMVKDLILFLLKSKPFSKKANAVQIILLLLTVTFLFTMLNPVSYSASPISALLNYSLLVFSIYFIYQYLLKHFLSDEKAYKKAIILFAVSIICAVGSTFIARMIDLYIFKSDGYTLLAERPIYFELGFLFSFALGNFLNTLRSSYFQHKRRSKELDNANDKMLASEAALNSIQASTNPHFLYNSLNAVASLAKTDPQKTEEMALALSKFYKYQTNRSGNPLTLLTKELEMIENYLAIEKIRFGERLQFSLETGEDLKDAKIPHFLLQPLVENAIKYGYNEESEKIDIKLSISSEDNRMWIKLYDQGTLFAENLDSGYGLKSVMKKLLLFYPDKHSIQFINTPLKHVSITINQI